MDSRNYPPDNDVLMMNTNKRSSSLQTPKLFTAGSSTVAAAKRKTTETSLAPRPIEHLTFNMPTTIIPLKKMTTKKKQDKNEASLLQITTESVCAGDINIDTQNPNIALYEACKVGNLCKVKLILFKGLADINVRGYLGRTPVMAAAVQRQEAVFRYLVGKGCDLLTVDDHNNNVLHVACEGGDVNIIEKLLVSLAYNRDGRGQYGRTPLITSVFHGHRNVFDLLVRKGCNVRSVDDGMNNVLHVACLRGHLGIVMHILSNHSIGMEDRNKMGRTPVMMAAYSGNKEVIKYLIVKGCKRTTVDNGGGNLLHMACTGGHVNIAAYIISILGISIDSRDKTGSTPMLLAAYYGHIRVIEYLVDKGCKLLAVDKSGETVLHVACMGGHVNVVKYILSLKRIDIEITNKIRRTPVMLAAYQGHAGVVKYLVSKGCNLQVVNNYGANILHEACMSGNVDVVKYLMRLSAVKGYWEVEDIYHRTPVDVAEQFRHKGVVALLRGISI